MKKVYNGPWSLRADFHGDNEEASETAQRVRVLAAKSADQSLSPRT